MSLIGNYLIISKLKLNIDDVIRKIEPSYKLGFAQVAEEIGNRTRIYLSDRKNWKQIVNDYKDTGEYPRKYIIILMYWILTHETGGTEYGYMGMLSGKGEEAIKVAAIMSKILVEYGYFLNEKEAVADWEDFVHYLKKSG